MTYYLSLGANLGNREDTIEQALSLLNCSQRSSFYYSSPVEYESTREFCNCCAMVQSDLSPMDFLHFTQSIERQLGRTRKSENGQHFDREIDIDILFTKPEMRMETEELTLPHKKMEERTFVKVPLKELFS